MTGSQSMREWINVVASTIAESTLHDAELAEIGEMEVPVFGEGGKVVRTVRAKDARGFVLAGTFQALKRKRNPEAREMVRKLALWGDHLRDVDRREREDYERRWVERLDNVVWTRETDGGTYAITVNDSDRATYVALWFEGQKVGFISTRQHTIDGEAYTGIGTAEITDKQHRNKKLGRQMYIELLRHCGTAGIASYSPDRSNKTTVPRIYRNLGAENIGDYQIIRRGAVRG